MQFRYKEGFNLKDPFTMGDANGYLFETYVDKWYRLGLQWRYLREDPVNRRKGSIIFAGKNGHRIVHIIQFRKNEA